MTTPLVIRVDRGPIAILTLDRADRRNALSRALVAELVDSLGRIASDPAVRVVILTGNGPTFCAGMDLQEASVPVVSDEEQVVAVHDAQAIADLINQVHKIPQPTICAAQGDALAGGAGLALACDFVLMAESARLGFPEVRRGLVAAIVLQDLVRLVGDRRARDLLISGRMIDADEAERWGLINATVANLPVLDDAMNLARSMLCSAPMAIATTKRLLDEATSRPADLRGPAAVSAAVRVGDEAREGIAAFLDKRLPSWDAGDC